MTRSYDNNQALEKHGENNSPDLSSEILLYPPNMTRASKRGKT